ncbi:Hypothetical protein BFF97_00348 [Corynebacterium pseudotuberculosis]|uniref:Uncharacterized protein n=1 Tax=Corynebacterium ramonii TaxID=3026968 RepID=A0ABN4EGE1_9CORY|nr:hypothetical protein CPTA_00869 [Corynebacterium pseudotuberculosis]AIT88369.1 Hypothetical protein Cul210932_0405 [Corynebacterium ulcerans]AIU31978.1 Hypothetical protein CulFRC11_0385 [Corynebacterium ramonii FRC0011]AIG08720.1 hypothetical protein CPTB_00664 [Corynebacterium pseudotuberculosis]AIG10614.1 hypothetical protein CPTC_00326 [Corynebacterium pseudotuberculosis]
MRLSTLELSLCHCVSSWTSWWLRFRSHELTVAVHSDR